MDEEKDFESKDLEQPAVDLSQEAAGAAVEIESEAVKRSDSSIFLLCLKNILCGFRKKQG